MVTISTAIKEGILKMNGLELYNKSIIVEEVQNIIENMLCKYCQTGACRYKENCKYRHV